MGQDLAVVFSLPTSPFAPLAVGFFGLGTGYLIYGLQELLGFRRAAKELTTAPASGASGCRASCNSSPASLNYTLPM